MALSYLRLPIDLVSFASERERRSANWVRFAKPATIDFSYQIAIPAAKQSGNNKRNSKLSAPPGVATIISQFL
jgi:hypothetical protein